MFQILKNTLYCSPAVAAAAATTTTTTTAVAIRQFAD